MKVYNSETARSKRWAIALQDFPDGSAVVNAVDADTGSVICKLIVFPPVTGGYPYPKNRAREFLSENGYDPFEHGYMFNSETGAINFVPQIAKG